MGLKEDVINQTVSNMNIRPAVTIPLECTVRDAVKKMRSAGLGCIIAVDQDNRAAGIFTEAMLRHALNESVAVLDDALASQIVTRLPWVLPTDEVKLVLDAMEENNIRFIAVLNEEHRVIGITGQKTMMEFVADTFPHEVMTQNVTDIPPSLQKEGA